MLLSLSTALFLAAEHALSSQIPLGLGLSTSYHPPHTNISDANHIFNALSGLLTQLPNTLHPNGHTAVPAIILPRTLLYHSRQDTDLPPKQEWLAFDPEMSYSIFVPKGETYLITYSVNRPLRVLYFDGMSAELTGNGVLDYQEVFLARKGGELHGWGWFDDYSRLEGLCQWARNRTIDGFIRMNAGFEVMYCDFDQGLDLVSHINITAPDTPPGQQWHPPGPGGPPRRGPGGERLVSFEDHPERPYPGQPYPGRPPHPPGGGGGRRPPWQMDRSPLAYGAGYEWLRIATNRYFSPQPQVKLLTSGMVTFYDPRFKSLLKSRKGRETYEHRIWEDISDGDASLAVDTIESILNRADLWSSPVGSNVEWEWIARRVQEYWGSRIAQMHDVLTANASEAFNATQAVIDVRLLAFTLVNPYLDTTAIPFSNQSDPALWRPSTFSRCVRSTTEYIQDFDLTPQELLLKSAIETILNRLCTSTLDILEQALARTSRDHELVSVWTNTLVSLKEWLDWPVWVTCDESCGWNSLCLIPIWPVSIGRGGSGEPREDDPIGHPMPQCVSYDAWITSQQGVISVDFGLQQTHASEGMF